MRALKGLVIGMGVLIVVGLTTVVVTIAMRATGTGSAGSASSGPADAGAEATADAGDMTPSPQANSPQSPAGARPFGELRLGTADSCRIAGTVESGGTLVVRLDGPAKDGCDQLVVVDPGQGRVLGRIRPGGAEATGGEREAGQ